MSDLIRKYNLNFEVFSSRIVHRETLSTINFRGFREQGSFNIQGMEGVDITWIDESQALTKQTLDVLIPTIRKDNAKIFFTMNRHVPNDPAYSLFVNRDDCLHIHINYNENKFCTNALIREAEECKKRSESDYNHIWLGEPLYKTEDSVFSFKELKDTQINKYQPRQGYGKRVAGFDIARYGDDKCAVVVLQQMGALHWETVYVDEWEHKDLNYTTGRILLIAGLQEVMKSKIDEDGIGAGPLDTLNKGRGLEQFVGFRNPVLGYKDNKDFGNPRTANAYKLKDMVTAGHIAITNDKLIEELITLKYTFDHQQRRILVSKEKMRKDGIKSPNLADALIMAVSLVDDVQAQQDNQYRPQNRSARDENLFSLAGIR